MRRHSTAFLLLVAAGAPAFAQASRGAPPPSTETQAGRPLATLVCRTSAEAQADWLALTPEGYETNSPGLSSKGHWRMAGQPTTEDVVRKNLVKPEMVAKALRAEPVPPVAFAK